MLQPQETINSRYILQQTLGNTAPGRQTWLAVDLLTPNQDKVVIKLLAFHPETHWEDIKLFQREAQILRQLNHPQIPKYRDYFTLEPELGDGLPQLALVQDYIQGKSLEEMLKQKKLEPEKVVVIAQQVLNILVYLHELSPPVLHRDIKPSNLILGEQIYLIDFGSVQDQAKNKNATFTIVGTQGYAPPEQLMGKAVAASDLYSLGATLVRLLTGVEPADLPQSNCRLLWSNMASVSDDFIQWLNRLIDPDLEVRFSTAKQVITQLEPFCMASSFCDLEAPLANSNSAYKLPVLGILGVVMISFMTWLSLSIISDAKNANKIAKEEAIATSREITGVRIEETVTIVEYEKSGCGWSGCGEYSESVSMTLELTPKQAQSFLDSNPQMSNDRRECYFQCLDDDLKSEVCNVDCDWNLHVCIDFQTSERLLNISTREMWGGSRYCKKESKPNIN